MSSVCVDRLGDEVALGGQLIFAFLAAKRKEKETKEGIGKLILVLV